MICDINEMLHRTLFPFSLIAFALLTGCDSPSPRFAQGTRYEASADGSDFTFYRLGEEVEIYRISPEALPGRSATFAKAAIAVHTATGCDVVPGSMSGDAALMMAEIICG